MYNTIDLSPSPHVKEIDFAFLPVYELDFGATTSTERDCMRLIDRLDCAERPRAAAGEPEALCVVAI